MNNPAAMILIQKIGGGCYESFLSNCYSRDELIGYTSAELNLIDTGKRKQPHTKHIQLLQLQLL